ncbi:MAG: hypothetical protein RQ826_02585 [Xanthomonadales bacterium]|nr:hypothetical protein [Xanthomonadales bacterium]
MKKVPLGMTLGVLVFGLLAAQALYAAPACKGPNKNDPGCVAQVASPAVVDSVTVDWLNQVVTVRGSNFAGTTAFMIGAIATPLAVAYQTDTRVDLPFNADISGEVLSEGSYNLVVDGAVVLSVYFEDQVIDPAATGCPCETDWATALVGLWGSPQTDCYEIEGPLANDISDISGTVLSLPGDPDAHPQYPIGASFYPGQPGDSYCALVQVDGDATTTELANERINELQQEDCASALKAQVCANVYPLP